LRFVRKLLYHIQRLVGAGESAGFAAVVGWEVLHFAAWLGLPQPVKWRLWPRQVAHPLHARLRGSSDLSVFEQTFIVQEYSCLRDLREPLRVLDLGANVGFTAAYFLSIFPRASLIAVEPDEGNLAICRTNLLPYGERARVLPGAVWSQPATLRLIKGTFGDGREWATQVGALLGASTKKGRASLRGEVQVQAWDVGSIIDINGGGMVDLLKIDIERAEIEVFGESAASWLPRVRNICIELHGRDCEEVFFAALWDFDYELERSGELTICRNLRPRQMVCEAGGPPRRSGMESR
jgi:FkbM family methyltransferase